jgi:hypothetical protein
MRETVEEVQDKCLAFDNNLDFDADNVKIEEGDHVIIRNGPPGQSSTFHSCFKHGVS